jgi:hypothetical protein
MIIVRPIPFRWRQARCSATGNRVDETAARKIPQARRTAIARTNPATAIAGDINCKIAKNFKTCKALRRLLDFRRRL